MDQLLQREGLVQPRPVILSCQTQNSYQRADPPRTHQIVLSLPAMAGAVCRPAAAAHERNTCPSRVCATPRMPSWQGTELTYHWVRQHTTKAQTGRRCAPRKVHTSVHPRTQPMHPRPAHQQAGLHAAHALSAHCTGSMEKGHLLVGCLGS